MVDPTVSPTERTTTEIGDLNEPDNIMYMRGFGRRGMVVRPMAVAPMGRRRRRIGPLGFIPILIALGIVAYFVWKNMG